MLYLFNLNCLQQRSTARLYAARFESQANSVTNCPFHVIERYTIYYIIISNTACIMELNAALCASKAHRAQAKDIYLIAQSLCRRDVHSEKPKSRALANSLRA